MTGMPVTGHHAWGRAYGHDTNRKFEVPQKNFFSREYIHNHGTKNDGLMKIRLQMIILDFYYIYYFMIIVDWYMTITRIYWI
jgi:hypothetical protein